MDSNPPNFDLQLQMQINIWLSKLASILEKYFFHSYYILSYSQSEVLCVYVCLPERYRIQSDRFEHMWLVAKELVQRFDQHFSKLGIKDFKKSFSGPLPLQEYFLSVDHHFQVHFLVVQTYSTTFCIGKYCTPILQFCTWYIQNCFNNCVSLQRTCCVTVKLVYFKINLCSSEVRLI